MKFLVRLTFLSIVALGLCASAPAAEPTSKKTECGASGCCETKTAKTKSAKKSSKSKKNTADQTTS